MKIRVGGEVLYFFSTTTVFGTPVDVTLPELVMESFFPADSETARAVRRLAGEESVPHRPQDDKATSVNANYNWREINF